MLIIFIAPLWIMALVLVSMGEIIIEGCERVCPELGE